MPFAFIEGFDDYPDNVSAQGIGLQSTWLGGGAAQLQPGRFGMRAIQYNFGSRPYRIVPRSQQIVLGFAYFFNDLAGTNQDYQIIRFEDSVGNGICGMDVDTGGQVIYNRGGDVRINENTIAVAQRLVKQRTWHYFEVILDSKRDATGSVKVYLDGELIIDESNVVTSGNNDPIINRLRIGPTCFDSYDRTDDMYYVYDSLVRIGEARAQLLTVGDAVKSEWNPLTGSSNAAMIQEERADGDATYNSTNVTGAADLFDLANLPGIPEEVYAVQINMAAKKSDSATRVLVPNLVTNGQVWDGPDMFLAADYTWRREISTVNPITQKPWTPSEVNNLQIGYKLK